MGRLQFLSICGAILLHSSFTSSAVLNPNKRELERNAEIAVERAAEKAAERAVEKALNSGNSSTITITVKEAYENAKLTAEEAAAPGSESTKPIDEIDNRQYEAAPAGQGQYEVYDSSEAAELGISKEQVNSSVEELQAGGGGGSGEDAAPSSGEVDVDTEDSGEGGGDVDADGEVDVDAGDVASFESNREEVIVEKPDDPPGGDMSEGLDLSGDFGGLDMSGADQSRGTAAADNAGAFGMKRNTRTFSDSYSNTNLDGFDGDGKADVDDDEDAEIMKMYATDFGDVGWSSNKQQGWTRHRPLWDDTKSRVTRQPLNEWDDSAGTEIKVKKEDDLDIPSKEERNARMSKRMIKDIGDESTTTTVRSALGKIYEVPQRDSPANETVPYRGFERKTLEFMQTTLSPKEVNDQMKKDSPTSTTTTTHRPRSAFRRGTPSKLTQ